jgi:hypothetical protein
LLFCLLPFSLLLAFSVFFLLSSFWFFIAVSIGFLLSPGVITSSSTSPHNSRAGPSHSWYQTSLLWTWILRVSAPASLVCPPLPPTRTPPVSSPLISGNWGNRDWMPRLS